MVEKKFTSNVKYLNVSNGSRESTKKKGHRKSSLESIKGVEKEVEVDPEIGQRE